uniref:RAP domain-containing protein n=1 Tax=Strongyloides stercoralis TaxID=6248 RepID=A0A0K0EMJ7_STRER
MVEGMDTSNLIENNPIIQLNNIIKEIENLKKDCEYETLVSFYEMIELFFNHISKSNAFSEFLEYIDVVEKFLLIPVDIRFIIVKFLSMKPIKHPGKVFRRYEFLEIDQYLNEIGDFICTIPREKISLNFMISNTFNHERVEYYQSITQKQVKECSVEDLMMTIKELLEENKLNPNNVFEHFFNLIGGAYQVNFSTYKMFSSMAIFLYSNNISRLDFSYNNIIEFYVDKKSKYIRKSNTNLLEKSRLDLFTDIILLYFGIFKGNHIIINNDQTSRNILNEIIKYHRLFMLDMDFNKFDRENFQNSPQFILFKCTQLTIKNFISISRFDIAKELFEGTIFTRFFTQIPKFLQCKHLLNYCTLLMQMNEGEKASSILKSFYKDKKQLPLCYAVKLYKLYKEQKLFEKNRSMTYTDGFFLPILEGTIEKNSIENVDPSMTVYRAVINHLKELLKCSEGSIFNKNLWNEVCLYLIFNQLSDEEIESFFYVEHFPIFSKNRIKDLLEISCRLLLNLKNHKKYETISLNYILFVKYIKEQTHEDVNFKSLEEYLSFINCFDTKLMIKFMGYMLKNPFREINEDFVYLWDSNKKVCYATYLLESDTDKPITFKKRCALYILKKLLHISCYTIIYGV